MKTAFVVYPRETSFTISSSPWESTSYVPIEEEVITIVFADTPREVAEAMGLGQYFVEERNTSGDHRWQDHRSGTIQIPKEAFCEPSPDDSILKDFVDALPGEVQIFKQGTLQFILPSDKNKLILQIAPIKVLNSREVIFT